MTYIQVNTLVQNTEMLMPGMFSSITSLPRRTNYVAPRVTLALKTTSLNLFSRHTNPAIAYDVPGSSHFSPSGFDTLHGDLHSHNLKYIEFWR